MRRVCCGPRSVSERSRIQIQAGEFERCEHSQSRLHLHYRHVFGECATHRVEGRDGGVRRGLVWVLTWRPPRRGMLPLNDLRMHRLQSCLSLQETRRQWARIHSFFRHRGVAHGHPAGRIHRVVLRASEQPHQTAGAHYPNSVVLQGLRVFNAGLQRGQHAGLGSGHYTSVCVHVQPLLPSHFTPARWQNRRLLLPHQGVELPSIGISCLLAFRPLLCRCSSPKVIQLIIHMLTIGTSRYTASHVCTENVVGIAETS